MMENDGSPTNNPIPSSSSSSETSAVTKKDSITRLGDWNFWFIFIFDLIRSGKSLHFLQDSLRQIFSLNGPIFYNSLLLTPGTSSPSPTSSLNDYSSSSSRRRRRRQNCVGPKHITGLPNQGQTCFLNSVLQSLASLESFVAYLDGIVQCQEEMKEVGLIGGGIPAVVEEESNNMKNKNTTTSFSRQLLDLLDDINNFDEEADTDEENSTQRKSYSRFGGFGGRRNRRSPDPKPLLRTIGESNDQFRAKSFATMEQQDAEELLSALFGVLIEDAELDALLDRRFLHQYQSSRSDTQSQFDLSSQLSLLEEDKEGLMTSAMANGMFEKEDLSSSVLTNGMKSNAGNNGLSIDSDGDGTNILSLSGFLLKMEEEKKQAISESDDDSLNQVAAMKSLCVKQEPKKHRKYQLQEEKKQDHVDCEDSSPKEEKKLYSKFSSISSSRSTIPMSMQILRSSISSITPSPLSGWLGSTIQCTKCSHVRPIQNSAFLDIPLVPTSVPKYIGNAYHSSKLIPPNSSAIPFCTLDDCLADFTSVERVQDVECQNCTIQREIESLEEEVMMLRGAVDTTERRTEKKGENGTKNGSSQFDGTKYLRQDLFKTETRLLQYKTMDPDEDDIFGALDQSKSEESDEILFGIEEESKVKIERCDARKCLLLTRTPSILCCHIQRRYYDPYTNRMEKCIQFVEFPQVLDISPYCAYGPRAKSWAGGSLLQTRSLPNDAFRRRKQRTDVVQTPECN